MADGTNAEMEPMNSSQPQDKIVLKKKVSLLNGCTLIIGSIIGSGIFISPRGVLLYTGSVGLSLIVWSLCGVLSIVGALCYAELGTSIKKSGGDYAYIREAFGDLPAFLCLWVYLIAIVPTVEAILSLTFATYIIQPVLSGCASYVTAPDSGITLIAAVAIGGLTAINCINVKWSTSLVDVFTITKLLACAIVIVAGFTKLAMGGSIVYSDDAFEGSTSDVGNISLAFYSGLFAYTGWSNLNFLTEEMTNSSKNLPRAIMISLPIVTVIYIMMNIAYLVAMSPGELIASPAVAVTFAERLLGVMYWIMPIFVGISCIGAANAYLLIGSRLFFVSARDGLLPEALAMINVKRLTPMPALVFLCGLSWLMLTSNDIGGLVNYFSFATWLFLGTAVAGMIYMRWKKPNIERPMKLPLFLPILFVLACVFLIIMSLYAAPQDTGIGVAILIVGIPIYYIFVYWKNKPEFIQKIIKHFTRVTQLILQCVSQEKDD